MAHSCNCSNTLLCSCDMNMLTRRNIMDSSHLIGSYNNFMQVNHYFLLRMTILYVKNVHMYCVSCLTDIHKLEL